MTILLRHIIQELQKENANAAHQNKLLESENKLLLSETEQLRKVICPNIELPTEITETIGLQSMDALEDRVRRKLPQDEASPQDDASIPSGDVVSLQKAMREMRSRYEVSKTHSHEAQIYLTIPFGNRSTLNSYGSD